MSFNNGPTIVTNGLVLALDAADNNSYPGSGTTWSDLVGSNNGTLTNGPTFSTGSGGSIVFDGTNDYVDCGNNSIINNLAQNSLTAEAWINPNTLGDNNTGRIFDKRNGSAYTGWLFFMDSSNTIGAQTLNTSTIISSESRGADNYITLEKWNHTVMTYDYNGDKLIRLYVNGQEINYQTQTSSTNQPSDDSLGNLIIGDDNTFTRSYNGKISSAKIYNRALTAQEVLQNYNATKGRFNL